MKEVKQHILLTLFAIASLAMVVGCDQQEYASNPYDTDEVEVLLSLETSRRIHPEISTRNIPQGTYADNEIKELDILLFDQDDNFIRKFYTTNLESTNNGLSKQTRLRLPEGRYSIVVLANVHDMVESVATHLTTGKSQEEIRPLFVFELNDYGTPWQSIPTQPSYRPFPMWGESDEVTITATSSQKISLSMVRMLAKVNLKVNYSTLENGEKNFQLTSVRVFNYNKAGYIIPEPSNWVSGYEKATELLSKNSINYSRPLVYDNNNSINNGRPYMFIDEANNQIIDEIFLFESNAGSTSTIPSNTCIVIGGVYQGKTGYYRIDFVKDERYLDLVRNRNYTIELSEINKEGLSTATNALLDGPSNISYTIVPEDENLSGDIVTDGETQLTISPSSERTIGKEATVLKFKITTDFAGGSGLKAGCGLIPLESGGHMILDENKKPIDWIAKNDTGTSGILFPGQFDLELKITENNGDEARTGYVYIKSGKIIHTLTITQSSESIKPTIKVDQTTMFFNRAGELYKFDPTGINSPWLPKAKHWIYIDWYPTSLPINVKIEHTGGGVAGQYLSGDITSNAGNRFIILEPEDFSSSSSNKNDKTTKLTLTVETPAGQIATETIYIYQYMQTITTRGFDPELFMKQIEQQHLR